MTLVNPVNQEKKLIHFDISFFKLDHNQYVCEVKARENEFYSIRNLVTSNSMHLGLHKRN